GADHGADQHRRLARPGRNLPAGRPRYRPGPGSRGRAGHARGGARQHRPAGAPVRARAAQRARALPLPGHRRGRGFRGGARSWWRPSHVGYAVRRKLADIGAGARLFARLFALAGATAARPALVRDQVHFLGNHSLSIIATSGLFVGFVLALQGYNVLQLYGSANSLGLVVTLGPVRELGPGITALLLAARA